MVAGGTPPYNWAERRRIEAHPRTGALQIVEVRELVEDVLPPARQGELDLTTPAVVETPPFTGLSHDDLMSVGVPPDWLEAVIDASEDDFFVLVAHLPQEASQALLEYAATGRMPAPAAPAADPLNHPDALRRFRVLDGAEELQSTLDAPFEQWLVFLHPTRKGAVQRSYSSPARVAGSAGTGKTVVALHRVLRLLRADADAQVLLTTFSDPLARSLLGKLKIFFGERSGYLDRVSVASFLDITAQLYAFAFGRKPHLAVHDVIRSMLASRRQRPMLLSSPGSSSTRNGRM